MSLFDDNMLINEEDVIQVRLERAESLIRRTNLALYDLGLPAIVNTDETGLRLTVTSYIGVNADEFVRRLEDLSR